MVEQFKISIHCLVKAKHKTLNYYYGINQVGHSGSVV